MYSDKFSDTSQIIKLYSERKNRLEYLIHQKNLDGHVNRLQI